MNHDTPNPSVVQIPLTKGYIAIVDEIDADLSFSKWFVSEGTRHSYAVRKLRGVKPRRNEKMHRVILERKLARALDQSEIVDHIDGNTLNNTRSNLRLATKAQNNRNSQLYSANKSGYKGVVWRDDSRKWRAFIRVNWRLIHLGHFENIIDAARAYNAAALLHFGEFARLNEIPD